MEGRLRTRERATTVVHRATVVVCIILVAATYCPIDVYADLVPCILSVDASPRGWRCEGAVVVEAAAFMPPQ